MTVRQVKAIAKRMGLKAGGLRKAELINSIQTAEGNIACFGMERLQYCAEEDCLWRDDCSEINKI